MNTKDNECRKCGGETQTGIAFDVPWTDSDEGGTWTHCQGELHHLKDVRKCVDCGHSYLLGHPEFTKIIELKKWLFNNNYIGAPHLEYISDIMIKWDKVRPNAKLIAAAPEMLEALEYFRAWATQPIFEIDAIDVVFKQIENAIKKATT